MSHSETYSKRQNVTHNFLSLFNNELLNDSSLSTFLYYRHN